MGSSSERDRRARLEHLQSELKATRATIREFEQTLDQTRAAAVLAAEAAARRLKRLELERTEGTARRKQLRETIRKLREVRYGPVERAGLFNDEPDYLSPRRHQIREGWLVFYVLLVPAMMGLTLLKGCL